MNSVELFRAAVSHAETCHHFVKNQYCVFTFSDSAKGCEIPAIRRNAAHVADNRLDNHTSNLMAVFAEGLFQDFGVIERKRNGELADFLEYSRGTGDAEGRHTGAGFDEQGVGVSVITAF